MAPQQLETTNFVIHFDEAAVPNSTRRAQDLVRVCEREFDVLTGWFGIKNAFGPQDRIHVYLDRNDGAGAVNYGYQSNGGSNMHLDAQRNANNAANAADIVKNLFVAELVEIFMAYNNQHGPSTWDAGDSNGEGLSQLCSIERARRGHYLYYGSFVDSWLQSASRPDNVSRPEKTDGNAVSFGCALLFLYFLHSQLGYGIAPIIQKAGPTLEDTYKNLTGQSNAFQRFRLLIDLYFPRGNTPTFNDFDDPFPLLHAGARSIGIWMEADPIAPPQHVRSGSAEVKPFFTCPVKKYKYDINTTPTKVVATSVTRGFGQRVFSWRLNGIDIPASGTYTVQATVTDTDPTAGKRNVQPIALSCRVAQTPWQSVLTVTIPTNVVGLIDFTMELRVADKYSAPGASLTTSEPITAGTETVAWEEAYYKDGERCASEFKQTMLPYTKVKEINILLTLPDPPHDYGRVIRDISIIPDALAELEHHAPEQARQLRASLKDTLGLTPEIIDQIAGLSKRRDAGIG